MRFVIKVGTSLLTDNHHRLDGVFIRGLVKQIVEIQRAGHTVILVSSGAVASGRQELSLNHEKKKYSLSSGACRYRTGDFNRNLSQTF